MGDTYLADIPGNQFFAHLGTHASRASNAADAALGLIAMPHAGKILSAWIIPHSSQAGSATNFARLDLVNMATGGAGTAVLGSKSFSAAGASVAVNAPGALSLAASPTFAVGEVIGASYVSAGNGIALVAHSLAIAYQLT